MIDTVRTIKTFSLVLITIIGVATAQAGTVHAGHTTGHGNYHGNYRGGQRYYARGGQRYYANGGHSTRYWQGGYYGGQYYDGGFYPYNAPFFIGLPIPIPFFFPGY